MNGTATDTETPTVPPTAETAASSSLPAEVPTSPLSVGAAEPSSTMYTPPEIPAIPTPIISGGSVSAPDGNSATLVTPAPEPPSFSVATSEPTISTPGLGSEATANSVTIPDASSSLTTAGEGSKTQTMTTGPQGLGLDASPLDSPGAVHGAGGIPANTPVAEQAAGGWKKWFSWIPGVK